MNTGVEKRRRNRNSNCIRCHASAESVSGFGDDAKSTKKQHQQMLRWYGQTGNYPVKFLIFMHLIEEIMY